jgi:alanyl-tRNA synthetase
MTERLYYHDAFRKEFDAHVVGCSPAGKHFRVVLDRTAFYPTSGGQPHDTGRLGDAVVVDVAETDDGGIVHVTDRSLVPGPVRGAIDWQRRFDHMQQHTGQHLLSAVFNALFQYPTVSFHLGRESSTIDLSAAAVSPEQLAAAEGRVNDLIFEDCAVTVRFGTREELAIAGVRKEVDREGVLRAIEIEGVEVQPCGGTHVGRAGQIGLLLLRKCEKQKGNWRVEFVCGGRALAAAREDRRLLLEAARLLGSAAGDVPGLVARRIEECRQGECERTELYARLAALEAQSLLAEVTAAVSGASPAPRVVARIFDAAEAGYLRQLATRIVERENAVAFLAARPSGNVVFAQSRGLPGDMSALLRAALAEAGGKGGGTRDFAQGSCPDSARLEDILREAASRLTR